VEEFPTYQRAQGVGQNVRNVYEDKDGKLPKLACKAGKISRIRKIWVCSLPSTNALDCTISVTSLLFVGEPLSGSDSKVGWNEFSSRHCHDHNDPQLTGGQTSMAGVPVGFHQEGRAEPSPGLTNDLRSKPSMLHPQTSFATAHPREQFRNPPDRQWRIFTLMNGPNSYPLPLNFQVLPSHFPNRQKYPRSFVYLVVIFLNLCLFSVLRWRRKLPSEVEMRPPSLLFLYRLAHRI
jgi:hypothetical protein